MHNSDMSSNVVKRQGRKTCLFCNRSLANGQPLTDEVGEYEAGGWSTNSVGFCRVPTHTVSGPLAFHASCLVESRWFAARSAAVAEADRIAEAIELWIELGRTDKVIELTDTLLAAQRVVDTLEMNKP